VAIAGTLMFVYKYNYVAAAIAHGSFGGIGIGLFLGISLFYSVMVFALLLSLVLGIVIYKEEHRKDVIIGVLWAAGMSIGIILMDLSPNYSGDLASYLFGDILLIPEEELLWMAIVDMLLLIIVSRYYNHIVAVAYDREFSKIRGINVKKIYFGILFLITLSIVISVRSIGLILLIAVFSIPPYVAEKFSYSIKEVMIYSFLISIFFSFIGLILSFLLNISATASIVLVFGILFAFVLPKKR
jgi:zinc transport system permease protein